MDGSMVFTRWRQCALPPNTCCLGPTRVQIPNGILIVQPALHSSWQSNSILHNGLPFPLKIAPSHWECEPPSNTWFLGPITQTASQSVQPFLHSSLQSVHILYNGFPLFPSKLPLPMGDLAPPPNTWFLQQPESSSQMASRSVEPFLQGLLLRQTNGPRYSVSNNRPYLVYSTVMWPNSIFYEYEIRLEFIQSLIQSTLSVGKRFG